ncbi:MAG: hypothetical protein WCT33_01395 [Patescibacteria group bacterium]|jgi:hypothetical protein
MKITKKRVPASSPTVEHKKFDKLIEHTNKIKGKYSSMDDETKKKVMLGLAGAFAILTSIATVKKVNKTRKKIKARKGSKREE